MFDALMKNERNIFLLNINLLFSPLKKNIYIYGDKGKMEQRPTL